MVVFSPMKFNKIVMLIPIFLVVAFFLLPHTLWSETHVVTHFENTDQELTVYFINGKEPGLTIMIIGGIQGDEPGGYLAADLYADLLLKRGNLIVVPRANFYSIKKNRRGVFGDMNRKFSSDSTITDDYDYRIVDILKNLMSQSDVLLNLHEGSGFYYPEYISEMKNPLRYGQSIIVDTPQYVCPDSHVINLEEPAKRVIEEMNRNIINPDHHFRFNNHDTFSENSSHLEQRGSATFNALTLFSIPAYGIETSKSIGSIETKVQYETIAINAFMQEYGIIPEHPSVFLPVPQLDHIVVTVSGNPIPFAVKNEATLMVKSGSSLLVSSVVANYKRGISVDFLGIGNTNDMGRTVYLTSPTFIKVYKDAYLIGEIPVTIASPEKTVKVSDDHWLRETKLERIEVVVNKQQVVLFSGDTLHVVRGDILRIISAQMNDPDCSDFRINFYGFVGNKQFNDAEDRGYDVDTSRDLISRFSMDSTGCLYSVQALKDVREVGKIYIAIDEPQVQYLIIEYQDGSTRALSPGTCITCDKREIFTVRSVISNIAEPPFVTVVISTNQEQKKELSIPGVLEVFEDTTLELKRAIQHLGTVAFKVSG